MTRARNIKPGFFLSDTLAEVAPLGRLLFAGLWCIADREGRLEDRPKKIKAALLPYDECDVDALLQDLADRGFLTRYTVGGAQYIQVENFAKHQNPHMKEAPSLIPAPGQHSANPVLPPEIPEQAGLIPDSLNLIPDSLPSTPHGVLVVSDAADFGAQRPKPKPVLVDCPHQEIIAAYHELLPMCPPIRAWTSVRKKHLRTRWAEDVTRQNIGYWRSLFAYIAESRFLTGRTSTHGKQPFTASLDWIVKSENFVKIREGRYHREAT